MLGTLVRGRISVAGGAGAATRTALDARDHVCRAPPPVRRRPAAREVGCSTTAPTSASCCRRWHVLRPAVRPERAGRRSCTTCSPAATTPTSTASASSRRGRPASRRSPRRTRRPRSRRAARPAAARATSRSTGCRRSRPTPTSSRRSRATTRCCCSSSPRGCSPTTATPSATSTRWAWSASAPGQFAGAVIERTAARGLVQRLVDGGARTRQRGGAAARPRLAAARCSSEREQHLLDDARPAAAPGGRAGRRRVRRLQRRPGPRRRGRPGARRPDRAGVVRRRRRRLHGRRRPGGAEPGLRPATPCQTIEADKGWFLEHGRITPARSKQVTAAVNEPVRRSCARTPRTLVDAFGIPADWLGTELLAPLE